MKKYKILYIDDEPNNLNVFRAAFFRYYDIVPVGSAQEAFEILQKQEIHLIITDQKMPQMTGLEFLEQITQSHADVPKIILTGYTDISVIVEAVNRCGIYSYILKPWDRASLKLVIDNALEKYQLELDKRQLLKNLEEANEKLEAKIFERTQSLQQANDELRSVNAVKDKLFSIIAHDLRSPLNTLSNFINLLVDFEDAFSPEETKDLAAQIRNSLQDVNGMLNNLLFWSRNQMNKTHLELMPLDAKESISQTLRVFAHVAQQKNITIDYSQIEDGTILADGNMLEVILRNLLSNAIKFTHKDGKINVTAWKENSFYLIKVQDFGVGMSEEVAQKIFDPEQHYTSYGTANEKGTGIGLKLCKEFAEMQNGQITFQSVAQQGTSFMLHLPLAQP